MAQTRQLDPNARAERVRRIAAAVEAQREALIGFQQALVRVPSVTGDEGRVQYDSPYVRHLPTTLVIQETRGDAFEQRVVRPTFEDPYTHEIEYFHDVMTSEMTPKTTPEDFMEDLRLTHQIVAALGQG